MLSYMRGKLKHNSTYAIALIMLYENRKSLIFMVLGAVVYFFIDKYMCVDYLCLQRYTKLSLLHIGFEDTSFNDISGIGIP